MREILFKAKSLDDGEWVEGSYAYVEHLGEHLILSSEKVDMGFDICFTTAQYRIDENTLCQYTGLTDKNGNMIWENDICSTDIKRPYAVVEFRNGCFMYNLNDGEEDYYDIIVPIEPLVNSDKYTEVIGNIFDNSKLLERN